MSQALAISRLHFPVTTLGPGRRVGIWFQGCSIRCPGCISADTWASGKGWTTEIEVLEKIKPWLTQSDGITISGGEPFDQPDALLALLTLLREHSQQDVLIFSGYPIEAIDTWLHKATGLVDGLISDPFELNSPQTLPLRGSDNQRLHMLTLLGQARFSAYQRPLTEGDRTLDLMFDNDGTVWLAGIPQRGDFIRLREILEADGHHVITSDHRSGQDT